MRALFGEGLHPDADAIIAAHAGSPRAFQPGAPTDPYVRLSPYTAPVTLITRHLGRKEPIPSARTCAGTA
jgi:hypothetical protein